MIKNILNWTCGGFFRALGRILCFLVIGTIIGYLLSVNDFKLPDVLGLGIMKVNAAELNYTGQYRLQYYSLSTGDSALTTVGPFNTGQTLSSGYGVSKVITRYSGQTFSAGTTYRISIIVGFAPTEIASSFTNTSSIGCFGTTSSSNWNADSTLISSCDIVGVSHLSNTNRVRYIVDVIPASNVAGVQLNINYSFTEEVRTVNVYTASTITTGPDIAGSIDEQTAIMQEEFDNISNLINQNNQDLIDTITEQNQVCEDYDITDIVTDNKYINRNNGSEVSSNGYGITDYLKIVGVRNIKITITYPGNDNLGYCFYNVNKELIECGQLYNKTIILAPSTAYYFRGSIQKSTNKPQYQICKNGNQVTNDILTDTDTDSESNSIFESLSNFNLSIEGPLTTIIRIPIDLLSTLLVDYNSSQTHADLCTTFVGKQICLPSGDIVWKRTGCHDNSPFGCPNYNAFRTFFQLVAGGAITWTLLRRLVKTIEKGLDPSSSRVDLMRL